MNIGRAKWPDGINPEVAETIELNDYFLYKLAEYQAFGYTDNNV
jgi:hypothetical protein